ncbi:MAG: pantetheine-phosphate adenylyltransferase [Mycoplasmataceae bacterium]|jgi:pantetheine-phosphate adenylyltransferase|nr:pantetheine-phosphate adenylyltransferase [Mycoplasmataceae bacterium]
MVKIAIFPGSFDPLHLGHEDIIKRAAKLFDKLYVAVSFNVSKKEQMPILQRFRRVKNKINELNIKNVIVVLNRGLTMTLAKKLHCQYIVRSVRNLKDYRYELTIAQAHYSLDQSIDTIFLVADSRLKQISSSSVRKLNQAIKKFAAQK